MGGMDQLTEDKRYVVMIEIEGPKDADIAQKVNNLVQQLKNLPIGARVRISITGDKP